MKEFRCVDWTDVGCRRFVYATALCGVLLGAGGLRGSAQARTSCADLTRLNISEATVTMAEVVQPLEFKLPARTDNPGGPGGGPPGGAGGPNGPAPRGPIGQSTPGGPKSNGSGGGGMNMALAPFDPKDTTNHVSFCRVAATLKPSGDSDIKIEVWLPLLRWNGKLMGAGNFGWAGSIMYGGLLLGLEHGYATVSTDTGHDNSLAQGAFALGHPDKMIDYGYRAAHSMTVDAKVFIRAFYGESPKHAYWYGCSLGGQMGLTEIQRFPEDYDGAIIGAPASPIVDLNAYQIWPSLLVAQKPSRELGRAKSAMLQAAVMNACDELDGAKDGEIEYPSACHFDPATLLCKDADNDRCLTAAQVEFVQMLYKGPVDSRTGQKIFEGAAPGTEGMFGGYSASGSPMGVATALFKYMVFQDSAWDWTTLDMGKDVAYGRAVLRTINIADNPNLKPFFDRGGKVLWYHGWMDGASPLESVKYMKAVEETVGAEETQRSMRLFAIPGMGHCYGGSGCDVFDKLSEIDRWIQSGTAPDKIVASKVQDGRVVRTHPLCAYPAVAKYKRTGDLNEAGSFECVKKPSE
jgi:feruloyl esterase